MANKQKVVTGIILAGGKSSRMGFDKGMTELKGKPMVEWVIAGLQDICSHIMIISNTEDYNQFGYQVYPDIYKNTGPIGGIFTGLTHSHTDYNFIVACDMPFINNDIFNLLLKYTISYNVVLPSVNGRLEPLCAFYHKHTCPKIEELILKQTRKMQQVIRQFNYKEVKVEDIQIDPQMFANINTPDELKQITGTNNH